MKRRDLRVGMAIAYGSDRYPDGPAIIIDTAPWGEHTTYMGRFGDAKTGRFYRGSDEPKLSATGVAVAEYDRSMERWRPGVVTLSRILRPWSDELERREHRDRARREREDRDAAYKRRVDALPGDLRAATVYDRRSWTARSNRVEVDIDVLERLIG